MATGVASWSQTANSNDVADSAVNFVEGQAASSLNNSCRGAMASVAKWRDDISGSISLGGTSTAYTLTSNQSFASLTALDGQMFYMKMNATNGASPTLSVDGLTAKPLQIDGSNAVASGALVNGSVWGVTYKNSANAFFIHAGPTATPSFTTITASGAIVGASISASGQINGGAIVASSITTSGNAFVAGAMTVSGNLTVSSISGAVVASQSDQETASSTSLFVTPGHQQSHPSAVKAGLFCDAGGNTGSSYNINAINDVGTGIVDVDLITDFSTAAYETSMSIRNASFLVGMVAPVTGLTAGGFRMLCFNITPVAADPSGYDVICAGDQ